MLVLVYVGAALVWLYTLAGPGWALAFAVFQIVLGFAGPTWWYVLLPAVLGPLAVHTATGDAGAGWAFALFLAAPMGACLIALGVRDSAASGRVQRHRVL